MSIPKWLHLNDEVRNAIEAGQPVVALESTLITHGLPWPTNIETATAAERAVRECGGVPATICVWNGRPTIGLSPEQITELATKKEVVKATRRDLAGAIHQGLTASTTVAGTMALAHLANIPVFATGGIGGAHRGCELSFDISADLLELARTPVLVVCAGAKSILDLPKTLEILESHGVPVIGFRTRRFPAFYLAESNLPLTSSVQSPRDAADLFQTHVRLGGGGMVLAQPIAAGAGLSAEELERAIAIAEREASARKIQGGEVTPFLLARLAELTEGRSLIANRELIVANARLASEVAVEMCRLTNPD